MSEVADSILFRQKLYQNFKESGLLSKLKTTLRVNLLQKLQKPSQLPSQRIPEDKSLPFHLRTKFIDSVIAEFLRAKGKEYSLSIFMAECDLEEQDCLRFNQLSEILNVKRVNDGESFVFRLIEQFGRIRCMEAKERSTQTDFDEPLSKKLQSVDKEFRSKIDYWKLIPGTSIGKTPDLIEQEERLRRQFAVQKNRLKRELEVTLKQEIERKLEKQYSFKFYQAQKQHEGRLTELKLREKTILDSLEKKKKELQQKSRSLIDEERKLINKYETSMHTLEGDYRKRGKQLQEKEKQFWKKDLEVRAKKREYEQTIKLVKQKVLAESGE